MCIPCLQVAEVTMKRYNSICKPRISIYEWQRLFNEHLTIGASSNIKNKNTNYVSVGAI
jgi:hypothetical protein